MNILTALQNDKIKYRHEYKFLADEKDIVLVKAALGSLLSKDVHAGENGAYVIRSVYFDDYNNSCYEQNEDGTDQRGKYRIRIYDGSDESIRLEHKIKKRGMTYKESVPLTRKQCDRLIRGQILPVDAKAMAGYPELLKQLLVLMMTRRMLPKVIVEYERIPYVCKEGNVRITLDMNIVSSDRVEDLFDSNLIKRPIMPKGRHILEVKYDEFLPSYIKKNLELGKLRQSTFSKYYLCRTYEMKGVHYV